MTIEQAWFVLEHGSAEGLQVYLEAIETIKKKCVEIVRCKDCKHRDPEDHKCDCGHDIEWQLPRADDWFCADGKRK